MRRPLRALAALLTLALFAVVTPTEAVAVAPNADQAYAARYFTRTGVVRTAFQALAGAARVAVDGMGASGSNVHYTHPGTTLPTTPGYLAFGVGDLGTDGKVAENAVQLILKQRNTFIDAFYVTATKTAYVFSGEALTTDAIRNVLGLARDVVVERKVLSFDASYGGMGRDSLNIDVGVHSLQAAVDALLNAASLRSLDELKGALATLVVAFPESIRNRLVRENIRSAMWSGNVWRAARMFTEIKDWDKISRAIRDRKSYLGYSAVAMAAMVTVLNSINNRTVQARNGPTAPPDPDAADHWAPNPGGDQSSCRPDGMTPTAGVSAPYCTAYDDQGRERMGAAHPRRVVGYQSSWRTGQNGQDMYLPNSIPWGQVTHVNYAFAWIDGNRISVGNPADASNPNVGMTWPGVPGAEMDESLPYRGELNLLTRYKRQHPRVKTLISVGGWAQSSGFYALTVNGDGSVAQDRIDTFADSVVDFLRQYSFDGVDIDYEYPTALPQAGNPSDRPVSDSRRPGLSAGYTALMKTIREKLDRAATADGRYYLLTTAGSGSGYMVRGMENFAALQYLDFANVMSYDLHGSWNNNVGPNAPLYDDGRDSELAAAGIYDTAKNPEYRAEGYFNTDWAYHYYRGALQAGRINLGVPYYTRGWSGVTGGVGNGLWGTASMPDQTKCPAGTGQQGGTSPCGAGATGVDNLWHDTNPDGSELGAGSNPMWHAKNLERGITPSYLPAYGLGGQSVSTGYTRQWDDTLKSSWLWNDTTKTFISTEDEQGVGAVADYVSAKGAGGVMIWELAGDYACPAQGECGTGYTMTSLLDSKLRGQGAYGNSRAAGSSVTLPSQVADVKAELVAFPTAVKDLWPLQPTLRITNNSGVTLRGDAQIAFDIPTSAPALVKDGNWKEIKNVAPGHTGSNVGGLKGDFHRVTIRLGACEDLPSGASRDIPLKYYLPITGPVDFTLTQGGQTYGLTSDNRRGVGTVAPAAAAGTCVLPVPDPPQSGPMFAGKPSVALSAGNSYRIQSAAANGALLTGSNAGTAETWPFADDGHAWDWTAASVDDRSGWLLLRANSDNAALDLDPATWKVYARGVNGGSSQRWWVAPGPDGTGTVYLHNQQGTHCLTYEGAMAQPLVAGCDTGNTNQLWYLNDSPRAPRAKDWDASAVYTPDQAASDRTVFFNGHNWLAQWWTQHVAPGTSDTPGKDSYPWKDLGLAQGPDAVLAAGETLYRGESITAPGGYRLAMQTDGNLVMYAPGGGVAQTWDTVGRGDHLAMQTDGNLVLYGTGGAMLWTTSTSGSPGAYLKIQDDGNLVVYQGVQVKWHRW
ncbi:glycosyl hydrolase family 18 protein [Kitasatospora sp. NPDC059722]|uniref:glycosyl hydrolase family 18 protein n=1 Tax=unclassified Kitasatospora TaxID=2633591 RepID=UPI0036630678